MKTRHSLLNKVYLSLATTLMLLFALEIVSRYFFYRENRQLLSAALSESCTVPSDRNANLREVVRMSPNQRIIYELKPNLSVKFVDAELVTNEWGTRGPSFSREKRNGTYRIVGLGDSIMFGWGLPDEQSYLRRLESELNARAGEPVYEVINTAVPGYNTVMEVEALKEKWLALDPDLVILGYCGNDQDLPNFIRKEHDILSLKECHLLKLVDKYVHPEKYRRSDLLMGAPVTGKNGRFEYDPRKVPEAYRSHVGFDVFEKAVEELVALKEENGFKLLVLPSVYPLKTKIREVFEKHRISIVDYTTRFREYMKDHGIREYRKSRLVRNPQDPHPSAITTALINRYLLDYLDQNGYLH
jgi:hypothetical protein